MPSTPWTHKEIVDSERPYTALLGYVQLKTFGMFPRFAWYGMQIRKQLSRTPGVVGYRLKGRFSRLEFWHLSAWESPTAIHAFVHAQPHLRIMEELTGRLGKTDFRYWTVKGSELPLVFERELHRLNVSTYAETVHKS